MTYAFFASAGDKKNILDFIFNEIDLKIFDLYSPYGQKITEYKSNEQIISTFDLLKENHSDSRFNIWSENFGGEILFERINLDPKSCKGHTFRYSTEGWGLIQLYFEPVRTGILKASHLGYSNQKRAAQWESTQPHKGKTDAWDWKAIEQAFRKLKYHIHNKLSIRKAGSYGMLPGASELEISGIKLWGI